MTATTRSAECNAGGTLLMLAFDLGSTKWTLGFTTAPAQRPRIRTTPAGDLGMLVKEIQLAKARFGLPLGSPVCSYYEAGQDGFWLHRWLVAHEVANVVVEASSIEVNRRARRAKTDRLDTSKLLALLLRWHGGERHVWSVVRGPAPEAEAHRQVTRGIATVREDRPRVRDQGISRAGRPIATHRPATGVGWGRWQPTSALTLWFPKRFGPAGGRSKRMGSVALARKLAIARECLGFPVTGTV